MLLSAVPRAYVSSVPDLVVPPEPQPRSAINHRSDHDMGRLLPSRLPMVAALAAYYYLLCWCGLLLGSVRAQQQTQATSIPACSQLRLHIRSGRATVIRGWSVILAARTANKGSSTLGVGVRLDLPTGLVAERGQKSLSPHIVNGGSTVYWTALTLEPGKHRVLKLKARACGSATPGSFPLGGAAYLLNATSDVTCMSGAATMKPTTVRGT